MNAGDEIGGYALVRRLGSGGAGTVWLAEDGGGSKVALKLVHPALAADEAARRRLEREAATVNSVRSDRVAHVVDIETEASQPFIATEFVEGPTLASLLAQGPLSPQAVAALAMDLARTVEAVHEARIVHRDIKPSNIICSLDGPVLIDFGIAMTDGDEHFTRTGLVSGTAGYTAPELLRAQEADDASDWWAWTATLLAASTGRPPYGTGDVQGVIMRVLTGEADLAGVDPRVDPGEIGLPGEH
ncbi:MAG: serine/threonine-protein kinase, partial [Schaalia hyovaginalis]|uniref:serine/threonine-protein kinase n=1 Tax=Schaalia hyovaginalis TaxID=29316 RepID=UPI002A765935